MGTPAPHWAGGKQQACEHSSSRAAEAGRPGSRSRLKSLPNWTWARYPARPASVSSFVNGDSDCHLGGLWRIQDTAGRREGAQCLPGGDAQQLEASSPSSPEAPHLQPLLLPLPSGELHAQILHCPQHPSHQRPQAPAVLHVPLPPPPRVPSPGVPPVSSLPWKCHGLVQCHLLCDTSPSAPGRESCSLPRTPHSPEPHRPSLLADYLNASCFSAPGSASLSGLPATHCQGQCVPMRSSPS